MTINVLFVCLGNICRSPTAHGVFEQLVEQRRLSQRITVDSAGTGDWHIGRSPDRRAANTAASRGYDLSKLRARQVNAEDFQRFEYILAMDDNNLSDLQTMCPTDFSGELELFLPYSGLAQREVPDPYYGADDGFEQVLSLVEQASQQLLERLITTHQL